MESFVSMGSLISTSCFTLPHHSQVPPPLLESALPRFPSQILDTFTSLLSHPSEPALSSTRSRSGISSTSWAPLSGAGFSHVFPQLARTGSSPVFPVPFLALPFHRDSRAGSHLFLILLFLLNVQFKVSGRSSPFKDNMLYRVFKGTFTGTPLLFEWFCRMCVYTLIWTADIIP